MSCNTNLSDINQTFIVEAIITTDAYSGACDGVHTNELLSCDGDATIYLSTGETIFNTSITSSGDGEIDLGLPVRRFRNINTISGASTVWISSIKIITPTLDLGLDSDGNIRQITANNSVISYDVLEGGTY